MAKNLSTMSGVSKKASAQTPQTSKAKKGQKKNNAGGYVFKISGWERLNRFLILGSEGGTYYVSEKKLSKQNASNILKLIKEDGKRVVDTLVEVSQEGRAAKNDPALFVLALAASCNNIETRKYALSKLQEVARIGTYLFTFVSYVDSLRGWGKGLQKAIQKWYNQPLSKLAFQVCKYPSRRIENELPWTHRDLLRKIHIKPGSEKQNIIFKYVAKGREAFSDEEWNLLQTDKDLRYIWAHEAAKICESPKDIVPIIKEYGLVRESIPPEIIKSKTVYDQLVINMPVTATLRNLGVMTNIGTIKSLSKETDIVVERLTDLETLRKGRVHPLSVLAALKIYAAGQGFRGNLSWKPVDQIKDALDKCFDLSFKAVEPTGKRYLLGVDVSGSMSWEAISGIDCLCPAEAAAAMAMIIARTEPKYKIMGFSHKFVDLGITAKQSLDTILRKTRSMNFGSTDCALPMIFAKENNLDVDVFVVITDNETYFGNQHPFHALQEYRRVSGINAKLAVIGMTATQFSIADPEDSGMIDVVGMNVDTPNIIAEFAKGSF